MFRVGRTQLMSSTVLEHPGGQGQDRFASSVRIAPISLASATDYNIAINRNGSSLGHTLVFHQAVYPGLLCHPVQGPQMVQIRMLRDDANHYALHDRLHLLRVSQLYTAGEDLGQDGSRRLH